MGFEAPLALLGLLAVGIPVLAHLVRRKDLPVVELPTIALLERAQAQSRRRMRIVDMLLLAARILLVVLLALAIAGPYLTVRLAYGDGRVASVAIVVDDSMSMDRGAPGDTRLEVAAARARSVIDSLPSGSEVAVVLAGSPGRLLVRRTEDLDAAVDTLGDVRPGARGTAMPEAVALATRELLGARHEARRLVVLTDGAEHARFDDVVWPEGEVATGLERIGDRAAAPNRAVTSATAVPDPTLPEGTSVAIEVRSFGAPDGTVRLSLRRGDTVIEETTLEIAGGVGRATLHGPLITEGDPSATVAIASDDALAADDTRAVLLRPPASLRVLLVDGDPHPSRDRDEVGFLARALDMAPAGDGAIAYRTVDPDTLASQDLSGFDVVVLANAPPPPPHVARRLVELVQNGGGLLVAAGDNVQPRPYVARIGEILPARPRADAPLDPPLTLSGAEGARIVSGIDTGLDAVRARRRLLLEPPGPDGHVELAFEDGAPALAVGTYGAGRTAILAVTLDDDFSDLPYRPGFLPLVVRLLRDLSSRGEVPDRAIAPGESVTISPPPGATRVVVIDPAGERHERDATGPIEITETDLAGAWRVQVSTSSAPLADDVRSAFVVAPPAEESDLASAELPTFDADEEGATESGAVVRRSAAPWLFLLAGLLVLLEALLRHNRPVFRSALARKMLRR